MTLTEIQHALQKIDARPRQSLGQNFLHDQNCAKAIVALLDLQPGEHVVEIGPGLGSLTEHILAHDVSVTLIEKDRSMVASLSERLLEDRVELFHMDALDFDLRKLYGKGPVKVIGNLPYYVSTPLIAKFASALSPASILVFTLQHELAARLNAVRGTKDFGAMTICSARRWNIKYERKLPASVFYPQPKVMSGVVTFARKPAADIVACDDVLFEQLVRSGYSERRKQLRNMLPQYRERWTEICQHLGVPETVRAEELTLGQWESFACFVNPVHAQRGEELFDVVNEQDEVLDTKPREFVHVNNLRHRAVHMVVLNGQGEIFLQKRSLWKDKNPGVWDSSAAGHVDSGEAYAVAAQRELSEELGIQCELQLIGKLSCSEQTGWEFIEVYLGRHEGPFTLPGLEVETGAFFSLEQVRAWYQRTPGDFSPLFGQVMALLATHQSA